MKQVVLNVKENRYKFFMELINSLDFVEMDEGTGDSKEEIAANLTQSFKELKLYKEGKLKGVPAKKIQKLLEGYIQ